MNKQTLININKILERDSKSTTYKFALLRSVIDVIQENSPYIEIQEDRAYLPLGSIIEKWIYYYYPLFNSNLDPAQINGGNTQLAIAPYLKPIVNFYESRGGLSALYQDLRKNGIPKAIESDFWNLCKKLKETITKMPMKYIGHSVYGQHYQIFNFVPERVSSKFDIINSLLLTQTFGRFSIPLDFYEMFEFMGGFISGSSSIIFKWADYSVKQIEGVNYEHIVEQLTKSPVLERSVYESTNYFKKLLSERQSLECVWSGKSITNPTENNIDHLIPYTIWHNNDLWNLLPTHKTTNSKKSDKIPDSQLINKRKDSIISYWELLQKEFTTTFNDELEMSILGTKPVENWQNKSIERLIKTSDYLINERGFDSFSI
jgi:hypothetical protein